MMFPLIAAMGMYTAGMSAFAAVVLFGAKNIVLIPEGAQYGAFAMVTFNILVAAFSVAYCMMPEQPGGKTWGWLYLQAVIIGGIYTTAMSAWMVWAQGHPTWTCINLLIGVFVVTYGTLPQRQEADSGE